jgi:putative polyhydroxyalkanoate system protein
MASFQVTVPHALGQEAARARVERFLDEMQRDYADQISDVQGTWTGNQLDFAFVATGLQIGGTLAVNENDVQVSGPLPLMAAMFRGRIEKSIREELQRLLV